MTPNFKPLAIGAALLGCLILFAATCYAAVTLEDPAASSVSWLLTVVPLLGMAVAANQVTPRQEGDKQKYLVAASTRLYQGTLAFANSGGYADDDTGSGANEFAGVVIDEVDNSSGSNGDLSAELWQEGVFELTGSGFTQADVGADAYATDNYTVTTTASGAVKIGRIVEYVSATKVRVKIAVINS